MDTKAEVTLPCGAPCPNDPTWTCTREKDHAPDWHVIQLFSGSVSWLVNPELEEAAKRDVRG